MTTSDIQQISVSAIDLAKVLGVSQPRISRMESDGRIRRDKEQKFNLCQSVQSYVMTIKSSKTDSDKDYESARSRKMQSSAELEEMEVDKRRGELIEISEIAKIVKNEYSIVRQRLFSLPNKVAMDVVACESAQEAQTAMQDALNEVLSELQFDKETAAKEEVIEKKKKQRVKSKLRARAKVAKKKATKKKVTKKKATKKKAII